MRPDYPLSTERLLLRPLELGDAEAVHSYQSLPEFCRYVPYEPRSLDEVAERIARPTGSTLEHEGDALVLGVVRRADGVLVGDVMLRWVSEEHAGGELGYGFHPSYRGNGYATEAARALLDLAFGPLGWHRVIARIDARNTASAAVLERLGMRREAYLRENEWFKGEWGDEIDYAVLASEWRG